MLCQINYYHAIPYFIFSFIEDMEELTENEDLLILKQEISALCIHPMEEEIMVAAGDLKGNVGIWLKVSFLSHWWRKYVVHCQA